jgi:TonB family protein
VRSAVRITSAIVFASASSAVSVAQAVAPELTFPLGKSGFVCEAPYYPAAALRANAQGSSTIRYVVNENNEIVAAEIQVSSGGTREHKLLDRSALLMVRSCKYKAEGTAAPGTFTFEQRWSIR